jgi:hypothetical protein
MEQNFKIETGNLLAVLDKEFLAFYGAKLFITMSLTARHW